MEYIVAFATDDGEELVDRHFGEASRYDTWLVSADSARYLGSVAGDPSEEEEDEHHGDPHKARSIARILDATEARVMVSRQFGKNIQRMRKRFLPVIVRVQRIDAALVLLQAAWERVSAEVERGPERSHLILPE